MGTIRLTDPLASSLFPVSRQEVLALLYSHPDRAFYLREVAEIAGVGMGQVQRELKRLSDSGIIRRFRRGRHVFFQASPACPIYEELRGLVLKTVGAASVLATALDPLSDKIVVALIYGSLARGEERRASDVDLMVIGEVSFAEVVGVIADAESQLRREVNPTVYPPREFAKELAAGNHFLTSVMKQPKVFVLGGDHELGTLASEFVD